MRKITDEQGREWSANRVGRTSGIMLGGKDKKQFIEPADIIRFNCPADDSARDREITAKAGMLERLSDSELMALLKASNPV